MKNFLFGVLLVITIFLTYKQCTQSNNVVINSSSALIQEQLKNVSKLVVSEGHFSEVFNYKSSKEIFKDYYKSEKKALVVINADVSIAYDLKQLKYELDEASKTLQILSIPEHEISINPDLEYYDIQDGFFNPFEAKDYNDIKKTINVSLIKKIEASNLVSNAQNRLISELSKLFILTKSMGWTLQYNTQQLETEEDFEKLLL